MRRTRLTLWLMGMLVLTACEASAESLFGMGFFGAPQQFADGRTEGRGGAGLAYTDSLNAAVKTPTQLLDLNMVTVTLTSQLDSRGAEDISSEVRRTNLVVPTFKAGVPLGSRLAFGFGFESIRSTQWTVVRPASSDPGVTETLEREGTLFVIPFELAWRVSSKLRVGGGLLVERGTVRQRYEADLGSGLQDPREVKEDTHRALAARVAVAVHDVGPLSVAGTFVPEHEAEVSVNQRGVALGANVDSERTDTRPARWGMGARAKLVGRWSVGADVESEAWSKYEGRGFTDSEGRPVRLQDELTLRGGIERDALRDATGWKTPWRLGYYWRRLNYPLLGNDVTEWGITVGTGIPFRSGRARADLVVGYGRIGSLDLNGAQEDVFRITFSVTGAERWY